MSYKGYSFNLHKKDDKDLIDWLNNKKVTQTIKVALRKQMEAEEGGSGNDDSKELISVMKKLISDSNKTNKKKTKEEQSEEEHNANKIKINHYLAKNKTVILNDEEQEDFDNIFDV